VWYEFVVDAGESHKDGGCSIYRDAEYHNKSCEELKRLFPQFITIKYKPNPNKNMKGVMMAHSQVQWKKAYQSSQTSSLDGFMD